MKYYAAIMHEHTNYYIIKWEKIINDYTFIRNMEKYENNKGPYGLTDKIKQSPINHPISLHT